MSRTDPQFKLRMPPALRAQVEQAAGQANRSLNAEIVTRLQASFTQAKPEVSANEKPEPVPAPAAPRELRLLCVLRQSKLVDAPSIVSIGYLPHLKVGRHVMVNVALLTKKLMEEEWVE